MDGCAIVFCAVRLLAGRPGHPRSTRRQLSQTFLASPILTHLSCSVGRAADSSGRYFSCWLVSAQGMATLPLQFLLWLNLPPFMAEPINLVWWTLPVELSFYLLLPLLGLLVRRVSWNRLLLAAVMITLGWRAGWFLSTDTDNYLAILPILDSLPGVLLTFMLGFSMNFLPSQLSVSQRRWGVLVSSSVLLMLMQWQLVLNDVYWTGHWILVIWPPMIALPIAGWFFFREPTPGWQWLGNVGWYGWVTLALASISGISSHAYWS